MENILESLERFGISYTAHSETTLTSHLKGTYEILKRWDCENYICMAGLCHSIYGTESFSKTPATLDNREFMNKLIGQEAEELTYLFGAHQKEFLWRNLHRVDSFSLHDRFLDRPLVISSKSLSDLITLTLANWLEQRPRVSPEHLLLRKEEFLRSGPYLKDVAYDDFLIAYGMKEQ
jgi:hypothetical protein